MRPERLRKAVAAGLFACLAVWGQAAVFAAWMTPVWLKGRIDAMAPDGSVETVTVEGMAELVARIRSVALAGFLASGGLFCLRRRLEAPVRDLAASAVELSRDARGLFATLLGETRFHKAALALLVLAAAGVRLAYLDQPIRHDEAFTSLNYVAHPMVVCLSNYSCANNHLFYTFFARLAYVTLGHEAWAIRLPAFLFGTLQVPAAYLLARALYGRQAAVLAAGALAAAPALVEYSVNARGHALVTLLVLVAWLLALRVVRRGGCAAWLLLSFVLSLGLWTHPTMVFPCAMLFSWLALLGLAGEVSGSRWPFFKALLALPFSTAAWTALWYLPPYLVTTFRAVLHDPNVGYVTWRTFPAHLANVAPQIVVQWFQDLPAWAAPASWVGCAGALMLERKGAASSLRFLAAVLLGFAAVLSVHPVIPFPRMTLYLLVFYWIVAAAGWARLLALGLGERLGGRWLSEGLALALAALGWGHLVAVRSAFGEGELPEAHAIAEYLAPRLSPGDRVLVVCPSELPLQYHFERRGLARGFLMLNLERETTELLRHPPESLRRVWLVTNERRESLAALAAMAGLGPPLFGAPRLSSRFGQASLHVFERPN